MTKSALFRFSAALIFVPMLFVGKSECLQCYNGVTSGYSSSFNSEDATIETDCASCTKILFEGVITRGCSQTVDGAEVCDTASTITTCYCKDEDLCNTASTSGGMITAVVTSVVFSAFKLIL